ncbi:hypothetical protein ACUOAQ_26790, partial [Escherichia sp. SP-MK]
ALNTLHLDQVDYLYAYLQSINLTEQEQNQINANVMKVNEILQEAKKLTSLTSAQKVEALRLFLDSVKLAHLQVDIVDKKGKSLDLLEYHLNDDVLIQLKDLEGKLLATINPTQEMITPGNFKNMVNSLNVAMNAKRELNKTGKFVPMASAQMPNTASNEKDGDSNNHPSPFTFTNLVLHIINLYSIVLIYEQYELLELMLQHLKKIPNYLFVNR